MARRRALERWMQMAHEARAAAGMMRDPRSRQTLIDIAEGYENLVKWSAGEGLTRQAEKVAGATTGATARAVSDAAQPVGRRRNID